MIEKILNIYPTNINIWGRLMFEDEKNVYDLIDALREDYPHIDVVIVQTLGHLGDERAVEPLINALNYSDDIYHEDIIKALGYIKGERVVEPLIEALNSTDWSVRRVAAEAFIWISDERAIIPLIKALKDTNWSVRRDAAKALGNIGNHSSIEPLQEIALTDKNQSVRIYARKALKSMDVEITSNSQIKRINDTDSSIDSLTNRNEKANGLTQKSQQKVTNNVKTINEKRFLSNGMTFYFPEIWKEHSPNILCREDLDIILYISKKEVISVGEYDFNELKEIPKYWDLEDYVESEKEPNNIHGVKTIISGEYIDIAGVKGYRQDTIEQNINKNTIERALIFFVKNHLKYELDFQTKFISTRQSNFREIENDISVIIKSFKTSM